MNVAEYAAATAQVIRERGWVGGRAQDAAGRVCLLRAASYIPGAVPLGSDFYDFCHAVDARVDDVLAWNDDPDRTEAEVLALLDGLAAS